eukprot:gnl/Chilomastix_caulleri/716.p1 GENE.gnl/Chilomastix_caulleri/716~~gnl/Chilomastix_caulleri/716.p1  ORF type:complete len:207 (-),score=57.54 gnl/Chilomastix_caulleri/716:46-666(-)
MISKRVHKYATEFLMEMKARRLGLRGRKERKRQARKKIEHDSAMWDNIVKRALRLPDLLIRSVANGNLDDDRFETFMERCLRQLKRDPTYKCKEEEGTSPRTTQARSQLMKALRRDIIYGNTDPVSLSVQATTKTLNCNKVPEETVQDVSTSIVDNLDIYSSAGGLVKAEPQPFIPVLPDYSDSKLGEVLAFYVRMGVIPPDATKK